MHEVGITRSIVEIAEEHARREGNRRILSIRVAIGELSGVVPDAVEFAFSACTPGTLAEGAELVIDRIPGLGRCRDCGAEVAITPYTFECPACGGFAVDTVTGKELRIIELEVD